MGVSSSVYHAGTADNERFAVVFAELFKHTQAHFEREETLVEQIQHSSRSEHVEDHRRILGDLHRCNERVLTGRHAMARAWVADWE